jgi:hypothetical protein
LAHAAPFREIGTCIHVFLDRVLLHLNREPAFSNALLAHVMVHGITHVLEQHSAEGVMKAAGPDVTLEHETPLASLCSRRRGFHP